MQAQEAALCTYNDYCLVKDYHLLKTFFYTPPIKNISKQMVFLFLAALRCKKKKDIHSNITALI